VWTTTFQVRLPFGPAITRVVGKPVIAHTFGKILACADAALTAAD
jgi:hypothetical protein